MVELAKVVLVGGMLLTGTINTLSKKWQNQESSVGIDGGPPRLFHFPWTQTLVMYAGESLCMAMFLMQLLWAKWALSSARTREEERDINQTELALLIRKQDDPPVRKWTVAFWFLVSSCLDLAGTTLGGIGLLYTVASVFQMLRGSIIVFSGILSVFILKRKLGAHNWIGISITVVGLVCVGYSSMLDQSGSSTTESNNMMIGNMLVVAGQFANAVQFIVEEVFLKKHKIPPLLVVGAEGCWGIVLMCAIVLPILYNVKGKDVGSYENALDAAVMLGNNVLLLVLVLIYWLSIAFYNFCGLSVAKKLTSVHRTFIDALRTLCVWGVELLLYIVSHGYRGEAWGPHSYIQLCGFVLLLIGTLVYNQVIKLPFLRYDANK